MDALLYTILFLTLTTYSSATYCLCKDGVGDVALQKALDYACGAGANCAPILANGVCYQPNTVKDHCNWAVNSYFQNKGQTALSCDFAGAATQSQTPPSNVTSTCVYPTTASTSTTNSTTGTPPSTTPSTTNSTTGTTTPSTTPPSVFDISPTATSTFSESSPGLAPHFIAAATTLGFSAFLLLWG